jgi:hypothetical protein
LQQRRSGRRITQIKQTKTNKQTNKLGERKTPYQIYSAIISRLSSSDKLSNSSRDDMATKIIQNRKKETGNQPLFSFLCSLARLRSARVAATNNAQHKQARQAIEAKGEQLRKRGERHKTIRRVDCAALLHISSFLFIGEISPKREIKKLDDEVVLADVRSEKEK